MFSYPVSKRRKIFIGIVLAVVAADGNGAGSHVYHVHHVTLHPGTRHQQPQVIHMRSLNITIAGFGTFLALGIGYAVYFDYKRRNDPDFRRKIRLRNEQHRLIEQRRARATRDTQVVLIRAALQASKENPVPVSVEQREEFFMNEVAQGEMLSASGDDNALAAAMCFYRALQVYPNPQDLLSIYDRTVPRKVYELLMLVLQIDGSGSGSATETVNLD